MTPVKELISIMDKEKTERLKKLEYLKETISNEYLLAKLDFIAIENNEDTVETLSKIIDELELLQKRIIDRNK